MSGAENPDLSAADARITAETIRELTGAATPQFALQLRDRVRKLIEPLDTKDPVRVIGEREIARLEQLATEGQADGHVQENELPLPSLVLDPNRTDRSAP